MVEKTKKNEEKHVFQAEVSKLLHIVANSLYSEKNVFLRELISNSSDACDKLRYEAVTKPELISDKPTFEIEIIPDKKSNTLVIADNGIGMTKSELVENLGTIARSGTSAFIENASKQDKQDPVSLIGQFGVGFYSAFMVAKSVEVISKKASSLEAWQWKSDGSGDFTITPAERDYRGTSVKIFLKNDCKEYLEEQKLKSIIKQYSDHVGLPIILKGEKDETINSAAALWTRSKSDITKEQYKEFYHHVGHSFDDPWLTMHARVEGRMEYTLLLFIPSSKPFDLFDPSRQHRVKLYVKRVFVSDDVPSLVPPYLRFVRGIVDSEDLSLNISREVLQSNPLLEKIRKDIIKRIFKELKKKSEKSPEDFKIFWDNFGAVIKEGIYEDENMREEIFTIARFNTTNPSKSTTLSEYISRMSEAQNEIFYITGENSDALPKSPQLEGFISRNIEVLLLSDPIDDFWTSAVQEFEKKSFKSVTHGSTNLSLFEKNESKKSETASKKDSDIENSDSLIALLKLTLKDKVKDVRISKRLTESPVCLVADETGIDINVEKILRQQGKLDAASLKILEINLSHSLIQSLSKTAKKKGANEILEDAALLLLDQAQILEGEIPNDAQAFAKRIASIMSKSF